MTAKSWINAQGEVEVDFQPAMRFVPTLKNKVTLSLKASSALVRIDFRTGNGSLVNEALTDASVKTNVNTRTSWATRCAAAPVRRRARARPPTAAEPDALLAFTPTTHHTMFASRISSLRARLSARLARTLRVVGVTAAVLTSAACASDQLTAPATTHAATGAAQLAVTTTAATTTTQVKALLRTTPLAQNVTRSFTVRRNGGSGRYDWPEMGITVLVPDRSFPQRSITITVTALAGSVVAYEFGPEGQQFSEPLTIIQSLTRTNYTQAMRGTFRGAYFKSAADLNQLAGQATVSEFQPTTLDVQGNRVTFTVNHFSGYMVSMD